MFTILTRPNCGLGLRSLVCSMQSTDVRELYRPEGRHDMWPAIYHYYYDNSNDKLLCRRIHVLKLMSTNTAILSCVDMVNKLLSLSLGAPKSCAPFLFTAWHTPE